MFLAPAPPENSIACRVGASHDEIGQPFAILRLMIFGRSDSAEEQRGKGQRKREAIFLESTMPYEDEVPPGANSPVIPAALEQLVYEVNGAAIEVHRQLGPGLPEEAYHAAMRIELTSRGIPFQSQKMIEVMYKGRRVARQKIDLFVADALVVELKSIECIAAIQLLQTRTYIRLVKQPVGVLINFNVPFLREGIRRVIYSQAIN